MRLLIVLMMILSSPCFAAKIFGEIEGQVSSRRTKAEKMSDLKKLIRKENRKQKDLLKEFQKSKNESVFNDATELTYKIDLLKKMHHVLKNDEGCENKKHLFRLAFHRGDDESTPDYILEGEKIIENICESK